MPSKNEQFYIIVFALLLTPPVIIVSLSGLNSMMNKTDKKLNSLQSEMNKPAKIETKEIVSNNALIQETLKTSLKILKTKRGIYSFGTAEIRTDGIKTTWLNNGNSPIYGVSYLFLEKKRSGKSYRRSDPTRKLILSCRTDNKVIVQPGETFDSFDMLRDETITYEIKLLEINPIAPWYDRAKVDCQGNSISIPYKT